MKFRIRAYSARGWRAAFALVPFFWLNGCDDATGPSAPAGDEFIAFSSVSTVNDHACGVALDGRGWCWGANRFGVLGDGTAVELRMRPVEVAGGHRWSAISTHWRHSCGLTVEGKAYCWGGRQYGALGDGRIGTEQEIALAPVEVSGGHRFTEIAVGGAFACALDAGGQAWCWGKGMDGELGVLPIPPADCETLYDGMKPCTAVPLAAAGDLRFRSIEVGSFNACGVTPGGEAWCWGSNGTMNLATDTIRGCPTWYVACSHVPVRIPLPGEVRSVAVGDFTNCALVEDAAWCWGHGLRPLGIGQHDWESQDCFNGLGFCVPTPLPVVGGHRFRSLVVAGLGACGLDEAGRAWCWGDAPGIADAWEPTRVRGAQRFELLDGRDGFACGLTAEGRAWCWGDAASSVMSVPPGTDPGGPIPVAMPEVGP